MSEDVEMLSIRTTGEMAKSVKLAKKAGLNVSSVAIKVLGKHFDAELKSALKKHASEIRKQHEELGQILAQLPS